MVYQAIVERPPIPKIEIVHPLIGDKVSSNWQIYQGSPCISNVIYTSDDSGIYCAVLALE